MVEIPQLVSITKQSTDRTMVALALNIACNKIFSFEIRNLIIKAVATLTFAVSQFYFTGTAVLTGFRVYQMLPMGTPKASGDNNRYCSCIGPL